MAYLDVTRQKEDVKSQYNPSKEVKDCLLQILKDFQVGQTIMTTAYEEFGRDKDGELLNVTMRLNENQRKFNNYIPPKSTNPDLAWHAQTVRPLTRNKVISIVAHITSSILYPNIIAQNEDSVEDKDMAMVMRDSVEWACEQAKYEDMFINAVQEMCVSPATILFQDFTQVKRKIKEILSNGTWKEKEIVDEIWSGFQNSIVPVDELYIGNIYEPDIQKQPFLIRRKVIDYSSAVRKYGDNVNFKEYVRPGLRIYFDATENVWYEQWDKEQEQRLVEEVTYYNYSTDSELRVLNGVLLDDPERPLQRQDKKYPFAVSGYETYNSRFFYYMALVQKIGPDQDVTDKLYNMVIDGTYQQLAPTINVFGTEEIDALNFNPNRVNSFNDANVKVEPLSIGNNLSAGLNVLQKVESSASESSQDPRSAGMADSGSQTKYEVQRLELNAKVVLGRTGKMVAKLVRDFGELLVNSILQHMPIAEMGEVSGDGVALKFPSIFVPKRQVEGREVSRKIEFTNELPEADTQEELDAMEEKGSFDMLEQEERTGMSLIKVRPETFRRMKYLVKVEPEFIDRATQFSKRMMLLDRGINLPLVNQEQLLRNTLLKELAPGEEDMYLNSQEEVFAKEAAKIAATPQQPGMAMPSAAMELV